MGVRSTVKVPGEIGSQKIFHLIEKYIPEKGIKGAINNVKVLLKSSSKKIDALNIGVCDKKSFYILCCQNGDKDYYGIRYFEDKERVMVCSEQISGFPFKIMKNNQILVI